MRIWIITSDRVQSHPAATGLPSMLSQAVTVKGLLIKSLHLARSFHTGWQVPTEATLALPSSAEQGRENKTKASKAEVRTGKREVAE